MLLFLPTAALVAPAAVDAACPAVASATKRSVAEPTTTVSVAACCPAVVAAITTPSDAEPTTAFSVAAATKASVSGSQEWRDRS